MSSCISVHEKRRGLRVEPAPGFGAGFSVGLLWIDVCVEPDDDGFSFHLGVRAFIASAGGDDECLATFARGWRCVDRDGDDEVSAFNFCVHGMFVFMV